MHALTDSPSDVDESKVSSLRIFSLDPSLGFTLSISINRLPLTICWHSLSSSASSASGS
ncbi:hypothetical protein HanHA300_Chr02g0044481 [Helianthus annuus]|nr:hypothetical protein HanHA300_Chr02g0044481 [Helianthus annuus]KAJ0617995.1 hypothetical protein HanHA89_Chr02g0048101 [Helianthus annuus]